MVNMTNRQLLLKLWGYLRANMINLQLLLTLLSYLRVNMTNPTFFAKVVGLHKPVPAAIIA